MPSNARAPASLRTLLRLLVSTMLSLGLLAPVVAQAEWRVLRVLDGDTLILRDQSGQRLTVRLEGIDAPEKGQPYADRSRQSLRSLTDDCQPEFQARKQDRFGRQVGELRCSGQDVGLAQVEAGLAWHFVRYAREQTATSRQQYARAEAAARRERRGLWRDSEPEAPWLHRARGSALSKGLVEHHTGGH